MDSLSNDPSSLETMTSRASIVSANEVSEDPASTLSSMLNPDNKNIATQSLTGRNHVTRVYTKSPHYLPLACLALLLNPPLGIPAFVCACLSRTHRLAGLEQRATRCSQLALWLSLIAIASSIVIIIFTIVYIYVITPNIIREIDGWTDTDYDDPALSRSFIEVELLHLENATMTTV